MLPPDLITHWREEAAVLRRRADPRGARILESVAKELEDALAEWRNAPITPAEAEAEGVCTAEAVRKAVREGRAENLGTPTRVQVRRQDLPRGRGGGQRSASSFGRSAMRAAETANRRRER